METGNRTFALVHGQSGYDYHNTIPAILIESKDEIKMAKEIREETEGDNCNFWNLIWDKPMGSPVASGFWGKKMQIVLDTKVADYTTRHPGEQIKRRWLPPFREYSVVTGSMRYSDKLVEVFADAACKVLNESAKS